MEKNVKENKKVQPAAGKKAAKPVAKKASKPAAKTAKKPVKAAAPKAPAKVVAQKTETQKVVRVAKDTSNINPEFTDAFIQEVDEDVKNDNFKVLWNRYGLFVVAFVVIAVSAAVSFDKIRNWKIEQNQMKTENYMAAAQFQENPDDTIAALQKINQANQGIFSDFARLQIANVLFNQDKTEEALATLQALIDDKQVNAEVKNIALIKLATYKVDEMSKDDFAALLKPIVDADNSWTPLANDLLAMSAIRAGDIQTAKEIYGSILKVKGLPESFRTKVQDMLSSINDM